MWNCRNVFFVVLFFVGIIFSVLERRKFFVRIILWYFVFIDYIDFLNKFGFFVLFFLDFREREGVKKVYVEVVEKMLFYCCIVKC